jgi:hypothetical protein
MSDPTIPPVPQTIAQPSSTPVIGSKTFWAVVVAVILILPEIVQEVAGLNVLPPAWIDKATAFSTLAVGAAALYSRLAGKLSAQINEQKTAAVASAAMPETASGAEVLNAVRDSTEPGRP